MKQTFGKGFLSHRRTTVCLAATMAYALSAPFVVQAAENNLSLELNRASETANGCMLSFVASNSTGQALGGLAYEFVLFNADGLVDQMTAFDFGAIQDQKTVVRQFELAGVKCPSIGKILVNGAARCDLVDPQPGTENMCITALEPKTRTTIAFIK
ncbi:hypothetical protein [Roseibium algae]|uniref:Tat pathway signal sequence domain protein n=1 Tax=Roseibium algae TaxID=3123038 RepID=A0ABU8TJN3_9HYPH